MSKKPINRLGEETSEAKMTMLLVDYSNQSAILHFDQISCLSHSESAPQFFDVLMCVWVVQDGHGEMVF